ncbi:MAG: M28 family metallopeptidase [Planctomycetaceae bacterium]
MTSLFESAWSCCRLARSLRGTLLAGLASGLLAVGFPGTTVAQTPSGPRPLPPTTKSAVQAEPADRAGATAVLERLRDDVTRLASPEFEGRGTAAGKQKTIEFLVGRFEQLGLQPLFPDDSFRQAIPGPAGTGNPPPTLGWNIGGFIPGTDPRLKDEVLILSAHHDHLGVRNGQVYPGADDNAGSVSMMLEVARRVAQPGGALPRTLVILSCDLEEHLLWGARWFVAHPPWPLERVKLFVTAELIGRTLGDLPLPAVFVMGGELSPGLRPLVDRVAHSPELLVRHLGVDLVGVRSDYGPFRGEKVPFLFFSGGEHRDYHRPTDTAEKLDYRRIAQITELVHGTLKGVAEEVEPPAFGLQPEHTLDEVQTIEEITGLLLKLDDQGREKGRGRLSDQQRFTVSNVHVKTKQLLEQGSVTASDRAWLIRSTQVLLLTVF